MMPQYTEYERIRYDDAGLQAEFQRLIEEVATAERSRAPLQEQHRKAETGMDTGVVSEPEFRAIDSQYIKANNRIAAAKKKVDEFLGRHKNYRVT
jgi:predicted  nucleic acid-binding Zn-ribbon protein